MKSGNAPPPLVGNNPISGLIAPFANLGNQATAMSPMEKYTPIAKWMYNAEKSVPNSGPENFLNSLLMKL